jgi:phosphoglycerate kinase
MKVSLNLALREWRAVRCEEIRRGLPTGSLHPKILGGLPGSFDISRFPKMAIYHLENMLKDKVVLIRCDFNGTVESGKVKSLKRVELALPTIKFVLEKGARQVILLSHNGQPKKEKEGGLTPSQIKEKLTLTPLKEVLAEKLALPVEFIDLPLKGKLTSSAKVILVENTRFDSRDESKDLKEQEAYASEILDFVSPDIYVLDGFSVAHREQASVTLLAEVIRKRGKLAVAGHLLAVEYTFLIEKLVNNPEHPFVVFLGGAKVSGEDGKLTYVKRLLSKVDKLIIGGAMAYPFLKALGFNPGKDPLAGREERDKELKEDIKEAGELLKSLGAEKLIIPKVLIGEDKRVVDLEKEEAPHDFVMRDVVLTSIVEEIKKTFKVATAFFNGPFGVFEKGYTEGTFAILDFLSELTEGGATTVVGGGETLDAKKAYEKSGKKAKLTHETSGGGASMQLIRDGTLPGFEVLSSKEA